MCGIAGIIDAALSREQGQILLEKMLASIRHRGPDNSSSWMDMPVFLGHNRLSIIDLSEAANQPMEFEDLVIVYNGEVYNYLELRKELVKKGYHFRTTSDTEVILAAYKEWGSDCVTRFVGMWAFAIWDKTKKELFCSRDRFGIKPFYYIQVGDKFYFGSEYKPLKLSSLFDNKLNHCQISRGLWMDNLFSYGNETYFQCLKILPARTNLHFKDGEVSTAEYWDIDPCRKFKGTSEDKDTHFRELFRDSVRLHMRSDVEVGISLSGGLDSSSIASVIGKDQPDLPISSFTIYYSGSDQTDERPLVREVVKSYPNIKPIYYSPTDDEVAACFDHAMALHDVPFPYSPAISSYFVMKLASQHGIKVMLDGQGADEYLGGYPLSVENLIGAPTLGLEDAPQVDLKRIGGSRLKQYFYHLMFSNPLPALLHYGDRMSMTFSIENRVPFLDHRLVEFVHSLEDQDIIFLGTTKRILRNSLSELLPAAVAENRQKQAFRGKEIVAWLRGPLSYLLESRFDFDRLSMLRAGKVNELLRVFKSGVDSQAVWVWRLVMLNHWVNQQ
jgi:asparagine synthase (glutamine-hydrolysing)